MSYERKNHTQSMVTGRAQQAFERLARDLRVPKSGVLQAILEAVPTSDLVALVRGELALHIRKDRRLGARSGACSSLRDRICPRPFGASDRGGEPAWSAARGG